MLQKMVHNREKQSTDLESAPQKTTNVAQILTKDFMTYKFAGLYYLCSRLRTTVGSVLEKLN